jgi:hypothetical protein
MAAFRFFKGLKKDNNFFKADGSGVDVYLAADSCNWRRNSSSRLARRLSVFSFTVCGIMDAPTRWMLIPVEKF